MAILKKPDVTIAIINYNGFKDTVECIKSLLQTSYSSYQIFLLDNGSFKDEVRELKKIFHSKKIVFYKSKKNLGFTGGNNFLFRKINTKYIVLINNDVVVTPSWLSPLVNTMEENKKIALIQPKILWWKNKKYFDYAGACGGFIDIFGYPFTRGRIFTTQEKDKLQYDIPTKIFWTSGAAMMIRKRILNKVGYFDETFFNYMEEIDLCFRVHKIGYDIVCNPKSVVFHKVASTASKNNFKKRYWEHRNNLLLLVKNLPVLHLILIFPIRMLLEYISLLYYLTQRRYDYAAAVMLSQISFIYLLPRMLKKRALNGNNGKDITRKMYRGSIIVSYFLLKKRFYSQLITNDLQIT